MQIKAELKYMRIAPRKVRLVATLIKGLDIKDALRELSHLPKRSSLPLAKLLVSAAANAKHNFQLAEEGLFVKDIVVNQGTVLKRSTPRAFGRASPIRKKTSHVSLVLDTRAKIDLPARRKQKGDAPSVRDLTKEDIKTEFSSEAREGRGEPAEEKPFHKMKAKPVNFVRRVFKRKAI